MKYNEYCNINPLMLAYCNAKGYISLEDRWESDKSNHKFTKWIREQNAEFYKEQTGDEPSVLWDENWRDLYYRLWKLEHRELFEMWLIEKYPHVN